MSEVVKPRPEFRNINALSDLPGYRWPLAALVSGMHRISGVLMFLLLPFILWMFDKSVSWNRRETLKTWYGFYRLA